MIIYKTTNLINGKIYVGKDCQGNPKYLGSGVYLRRAIKKYGVDNFKKEILEICDASNICEREVYWVAKLKSRDLKIGYNITSGGEGIPGYHHTASTKNKMSLHNCMRRAEIRLKVSLANKGKTRTEEARRNISLGQLGKKDNERTKLKKSKAHLGHHISIETRRKISLAHKGKPKPGSGNFLNGWHHSKESRLKISKAGIGRKVSKSTRLKIGRANSISHIGLHPSIETRRKMSMAHKKLDFK